jgi:hypothetical protein
MKTKLAAIAAFVMLLTGMTLAANRRDGAIIQNSGSTNASGYTIMLWSDGSAKAVASDRTGAQFGTPATGRVPMDVVRRFFADAKAMKAEGKVTERGGCMKSASFGSVTVVKYHGWTSTDLECPQGGALAGDAHAVASALGLPKAGNSLRRLPPNELRRPESTPAQASPSPESTR